MGTRLNTGVAKVVIVVQEAIQGQLGTPFPGNPLSGEDQERNCAVDPPRSAAYRDNFQIFRPKFVVEAGKDHVVREHVRKSGRQYIGHLCLGVADKEEDFPPEPWPSRKPSGGRSPTGWLRQDFQNQPLSIPIS